MGGLRSSCGLQFEIMGSEATKQYKESSRQKKKNKKQKSPLKSASTALFKTNANKRRNSAAKLSQSFVPSSTLNDTNWNVRAGYRRRKLQDEMKRQRTFSTKVPGDQFDQFLNKVNSQFEASTSSNAIEEEEDSTPLINFIQTIRPPLKSFAYTCKQTLFHLQTSFSTSNTKWSPRTAKIRTPPLHVLKDNLEKAITLFECAQKQAIKKLYQSRLDQITSQSSSENVNAETEAIGSVLGEEVILVYFFVFNMTEFARELITLVDSVDKLNNKRSAGLWTWLMDSIKHGWKKTKQHNSSGHRIHITPFVPNERNTFNTLHTPEPKTKWRRFFIRVWRTFSLFKLQKIRYAIKATVATVILATPAFMESTQDWYREYRMEWALITVS
jgi:dsDNA-binding SOS-regulon protein